MSEILEVNNKPATRISGTIIKNSEKSYLCDCEGDKVWLPKNCIKIEKETKTILVQDWLYEMKKESGEL